MKRQRLTKSQLAITTGTTLEITEDDGTKHSAVARSIPWQLGHGQWVVLVSGRSGGFDLSRCKPMKVIPAQEKP